MRGPQVVGGQACQVPSGPGLDQPAPLCWRPGKSGLWTHSGHSMEGTSPRVKTWKDKPPCGWRALHAAGQPGLALLPAAQPRPLTGGGRPRWSRKEDRERGDRERRGGGERAERRGAARRARERPEKLGRGRRVRAGRQLVVHSDSRLVAILGQYLPALPTQFKMVSARGFHTQLDEGPETP